MQKAERETGKDAHTAPSSCRCRTKVTDGQKEHLAFDNEEEGPVKQVIYQICTSVGQ